MIERAKVRKIASQAARGLATLAAGAWAMLHYLQWRALVSSEATSDLASLLFFSFMLLVLLGNMLGELPEARSYGEPSPRVIGVIVVAATGFAAAMGLWWGGRTYAAALALVVAWLAIMFVWQFASQHSGAIGEARFPSK